MSVGYFIYAFVSALLVGVAAEQLLPGPQEGTTLLLVSGGLGLLISMFWGYAGRGRQSRASAQRPPQPKSTREGQETDWSRGARGMRTPGTA